MGNRQNSQVEVEEAIDPDWSFPEVCGAKSDSSLSSTSFGLCDLKLLYDNLSFII